MLLDLRNRIVLSAAHAALLGLPSLAQPPETPPPPAAPALAPSGQQTTRKPSGQETLDGALHGERMGESKLEKETGTINDRILTVMPN